MSPIRGKATFLAYFLAAVCLSAAVMQKQGNFSNSKTTCP